MNNTSAAVKAHYLHRNHSTRDGEQYVTFESFEASPTSEEVIATQGHALEWDFPGRCAQIPLAEFASQSFQECLASFLEHASMESLFMLEASTRKAGVSVEEVRDTTDPALITHMLMAILEALGSSVQPHLLRKKIRDDVNFGEGNLPWRRLPFWLVLRVAAQRHLCFALGNEIGQFCYKMVMSIVLCRLLGDSSGRLSPHSTDRLRRKLARRMAKMEMDRQRLTAGGLAVSESMFDQVSSMVRDALKAEEDTVQAAWEKFKRATARHVELLPVTAPRQSLQLTLPNSGRYLEDLISYREPPAKKLGPICLPNPLDQGVTSSQQFTSHIHRLAVIEKDVEGRSSVRGDHKSECIALALYISQVMIEMRPVYESYPEQMSAMILTIFTLWTQLDKSATIACPLLLKYRPVFQPELLDTLQLPTRQAMERLQNIQEYLAQRHAQSQYGSLLDAPNKNCFAVHYYNQTSDLQKLASRIQEASDAAAEATRAQLKTVREKYDDLTEQISSNVCSCIISETGRKTKGCKKCPKIWARGKLKVQIHEAYLPTDSTLRSVLMFELAIPNFLSAYRDATWRILSELAHPGRSELRLQPAVRLEECTTLHRFMTAKVNNLSLASPVKCFSQTHYKLKKKGGSVGVAQVILPFAAQFQLFDHRAMIWVDHLKLPPTLEHICGVYIPQGLAEVLPTKAHPPTVSVGPSSYEIQANQVECPNKLSVHEFSALQKLLSGKRRRWPNILTELSSSNLNISNEETMLVLNQLAIQAGPMLIGEPLRAVHEFFKDSVFTKKLAGIVGTLLEAIKSNWREHNCMELIITLLFRLLSLSSDSPAASFLQSARKALLGWIDSLSQEVRKTTDASAAQRLSTYGLHAALLCRRTFAIFVDSKETLDQDDIMVWVRCSLALQENILHDTDKLSSTLRGMLIRDAKMSFHIQDRIRVAMKSFRSAVGAGISKAWHGDPDALATSLSSWTFLPGNHERWIVATTPPPHPQRVHFNFVEGHLLINGKPREKLPTAILEDHDIKAVFGDRHLLTYPSSLPGMSHKLAQFPVPGLKIDVHFGLRNGCAVMRTCEFDLNHRKWEVREFVPQRMFRSSDSFDLPNELVDKCAHWINLSTGCLEIRRALPGSRNFWITRDRDWVIDLKTRKATRGGTSSLVDPNSDLAFSIAKIFKYFEERDKLTIYQSQAGRVFVELKHMDLRFKISDRGGLVCRELAAEIDRVQDAGAWYGLRSKIVLRNFRTGGRSVLVPLGSPRIIQNDIHVDIRTDGATDYGSFAIDGVLGRLTCKPEPRLIYNQAFFHAATSFCLPDPLTRRTGSEEAFAILQSARAQPWTPLTLGILSTLDLFTRLAPDRMYYPPPLKRLQTVKWDKSLTPTIQLDGYKPIIESIKRRSNDLGRFHGALALPLAEPGHLCLRGMHQRNVYERSMDEKDGHPTSQVYRPRDRYRRNASGRVYEIARAVLSGGRTIRRGSTLMNLLESCPIIGGFPEGGRSSSSTKPLVSRIETPVNEQWGELVRLCQTSDSTSDLLFLLGLLSFNDKADMDAIHTLAAFGVVAQLKHLKPPVYNCFTDFRSRGRPSVEILETFMRMAYPEFVSCRGKKNRLAHNSRGHSQHDHERFCEEAGQKLIQEIHAMWPNPIDSVLTSLCRSDNLDKFTVRGVAIDIHVALEKIRPEWDRRLALDALQVFIDQAQGILDYLPTVQDTGAPAQWSSVEPCFTKRERLPIFQTVAKNVLALPCADPPEEVKFKLPRGLSGSINHETSKQFTKMPAIEIVELGNILGLFGDTGDIVRKTYSSELLQSLSAFEARYKGSNFDVQFKAPNYESVNWAVKNMYNVVGVKFRRLLNALEMHGHGYSWLQLGNIAPFSTPIELLQVLRSTTPHKIDAKLKEAVVSYGLAISSLQRLLRIESALEREDERTLQDELRNPGHRNWEPLKCTDWLLLELDSDILIREEQVQVAQAIIAPESRENTVLQLNMGAGKTSCVVPMAIAMLANGKNLNRLLVPKPLLMQTAQMIQMRLGGLVGRQVYSMPFSRRTPTDAEVLELYASLHRECRVRHGLILTCYEHLLSFKLGGWQKLVDEQLATAKTMLGFQGWLDSHCRDVLDECDFTLSVKTQLNYPSGPETFVDGHPYRWQVCEQLLDVVAQYLPTLCYEHPTGIEFRIRPEIPPEESFPVVQFLKPSAEDAVHSHVIENICTGRNAFLRAVDTTIYEKAPVLQQVLQGDRLDENILGFAANLFANPSVAINVLLLIRGLLKNRILVTVLGKRWNVQYGLHPDRHPVAVPYEAKGKPSEQAEFGHPDVAILLTCLSFYHTGLTLEQLRQGLSHVLQSDDPAAHYERWISMCTEDMPHWNTVNTDDDGQMETMWQSLRYSRIVINDYMNYFVFPAHARQFEMKLQACSWDIPLVSNGYARTTGFSGTNDNQMMLPLTIRQHDLKDLQHTSAEVLSYMLQPRNNIFRETTHFIRGQISRMTERAFLEALLQDGIRVLIDAGAYILENDNRSLVQEWLKVDTFAKAAVYFGADNRAWVHYRGEAKSDVPLLATPFVDDLSECVVFIDECHCRGVDLKLPVNARGGLTLALKQTKDFTIQGMSRAFFFRPLPSHTPVFEFV